MLPLLKQTEDVYTAQFFPGGVANPNYPDPGDTQGYTGYLTEQYGAILAFDSLIDPSASNRIKYAQDARNLLMLAETKGVASITVVLTAGKSGASFDSAGLLRCSL